MLVTMKFKLDDIVL